MSDCSTLDAGSFPERVTLELTNRCNLNCTFCPRCYMEKERGMMPVDLAKRLIDEMAEHAPVTIVPFFRGESLLHSDWFEILRYAQQQGVGDIQFTTNASLLTEENAEKLLDLDLAFVSFSLDTIDAGLYESTRRGGSFDTTLKNVLHFLKRRRERGVRTEVQVSAVETAKHAAGMNDFVAFWRTKVDRVRVYVEHSTDGHPGSLEGMADSSERRPCKKVFTDMVIYWNGCTALCNHDWTRLVEGSPLGNVLDDGIARVWQSDAYQAVREAHLRGDAGAVKPCDGCDHWKMYYEPEGFIGRSYRGEDDPKQDGA